MEEGLRLYELVDEQAEYSQDIYIAVDAATFTNTKKIKISTIYPLIDKLTEVTNINPATSELRISISAGEERRISVNSLLQDTDVVSTIKTALGLNTTSITFNTEGQGAGITATQLSGKRSGKFQVITGRITVSSGTPPISTESKIASIDDYVSPGHNVYFAFQCETNVNEGAFGKIDTDGNIYIKAYKESIWDFNVVILGA